MTVSSDSPFLWLIEEFCTSCPLVLLILFYSSIPAGYLQLLSQLTQVGEYDEETFLKRFAEIEALPETYKIVVIEDVPKGKIIATATLVVEMKFIRNCSKCGHIEDVVVDSGYRGKHLGKRVIDALIESAKDMDCYKVILDCSEENSAFYAKCGLERKEIQMVKYL